jgi:hypothetical protein
MKIPYRKYCKILTQVIKEAKHMHYNKKILESDNKVKAIQKIVKRKYSSPSIKINDNVIKNPKLIAHSFNTYFLTIIQRMNTDTPLRRPRCRWEDNIRMDLTEIGFGDVDWIHLAQDRDRWQALVNMVMNLRVP